ncbi:MAG: hypothetical protein M0P39_05955 [Rhodocyclaceae bacterium]|nr:hypothetical protein [Rhodocyclaceae bacterium]
MRRSTSLFALMALIPALVAAADVPSRPATGSASFCLFEIPAEENGRRRFINLPIVQYVELLRNEVRIFYGGGNFGSGHEARIPLGSGDQGAMWLERMQQTAATCAQNSK